MSIDKVLCKCHETELFRMNLIEQKTSYGLTILIYKCPNCKNEIIIYNSTK
jgi:ribosomal protein S27E